MVAPASSRSAQRGLSIVAIAGAATIGPLLAAWTLDRRRESALESRTRLRLADMADVGAPIGSGIRAER